MADPSIMELVLKFEDDMRDAVRAQERTRMSEVGSLRERIVELHDEVNGLRARIANLERETAEAWSAVKEAQKENNDLDAKSDAIIEKQRVRIAFLEQQNSAANQSRYTVYRKNAELEVENLALHKKIAELEKALKEFFPAPIIPEPWESSPVSIPQGEWVLRSNEALRNRIVELERQCELNEASAQNWKQNYERQMAINARQRSRIAELRLWFKRIANYTSADADVLRGKAKIALADDDRAAEQPITDIIQEAP